MIRCVACAGGQVGGWLPGDIWRRRAILGIRVGRGWLGTLVPVFHFIRIGFYPCQILYFLLLFVWVRSRWPTVW